MSLIRAAATQAFLTDVASFSALAVDAGWGRDFRPPPFLLHFLHLLRRSPSFPLQVFLSHAAMCLFIPQLRDKRSRRSFSDIQLLFLQSLWLFAQSNTLCLEVAGQWRGP